MTTCFVVQFGPVCLAAADTRLSADGSTGLVASTWDAADMPVTTDSGSSHVIPYRFRKIRQLNRGWAVCAGCHITGERMLNLLNREHATSATHATDILRQGASAELAELAELEAIPEVGVTGLYSSRLLGVPANTDRTGVWIAHLDRTDGYTLTTAPQFAMNWPASTSPGQQVTAEQRFFNELASMSHLADAVRAAATLIGTARTAPDSSLIVQIGLTWQQSPTEFQTRYFHGHADEIATMTNDEISARWEVLPN